MRSLFGVAVLTALASLIPACTTSAPSQDAAEQAGPRPDSWVTPRVTEAKERLQATDGGRLLLQAVDAHGGLAPWLSNGTMAFDFDYAPIGKPDQRRYSRSRVDVWSRKAVQVELGDGADARLGWNGSEAWMTPDDSAFPSNARFWATTPFYFAAIPWVLADPGATPTALPPIAIPATGVEEPLPTIKVTFGAGVGDAPDDYYILHLHPQDHRVLAVRYIVTYGKSEEAKRSPKEKILIWSDHREIQGLVIAHRYDSYPWADGAPGDKATEVDLANVSFGEPIPMAEFDPR